MRPAVLCAKGVWSVYGAAVASVCVAREELSVKVSTLLSHMPRLVLTSGKGERKQVCVGADLADQRAFIWWSFRALLSVSTGTLYQEEPVVSTYSKRAPCLTSPQPLLFSCPAHRMLRAAAACVQAVEEAAAIARAQAAERIAALQAQVLELQAGA